VAITGRDAGDEENETRRWPHTIELEATPDILAGIARDKGARIVVALPRRRIISQSTARAKLESKHADLIVANDVTADGAGFDHDTNSSRCIRATAEKTAFPDGEIDAGSQFWTACSNCATPARISATRRAS